MSSGRTRVLLVLGLVLMPAQVRGVLLLHPPYSQSDGKAKDESCWVQGGARRKEKKEGKTAKKTDN